MGAVAILGIIFLILILAGTGVGVYFLVKKQQEDAAAAAANPTPPAPNTSTKTEDPKPAEDPKPKTEDPKPKTPDVTPSADTGTEVQTKTCASGSTLVNGTCFAECPSGYQVSSKDPTQCVITTCFDGAPSNNGVCYRKYKTLSQVPTENTCGMGYEFDSASNSCVFKCPPRMIYDKDLGKCAEVCAYGTSLSSDRKSCQVGNNSQQSSGFVPTNVQCPSGSEPTYLVTSKTGNAWAWICMKSCPNGSSMINSQTCLNPDGTTLQRTAIAYGTPEWMVPSADVDSSVGNQVHSRSSFKTRLTSSWSPSLPIPCPAGSVADANGKCYPACPSGYQNFNGDLSMCYQSLPNISLDESTRTTYNVFQARPKGS